MPGTHGGTEARYSVAFRRWLAVTASFGVGVGIGIGGDFFRSVFARFLVNIYPRLRPANVLDSCTIHVQFLVVAKRHSDLLFDPDPDTDPDPDFIRFPLSFSFRQSQC
jgi:hypothetical protein